MWITDTVSHLLLIVLNHTTMKHIQKKPLQTSHNVFENFFLQGEAVFHSSLPHSVYYQA